jgi:hypothetical protein
MNLLQEKKIQSIKILFSIFLNYFSIGLSPILQADDLTRVSLFASIYPEYIDDATDLKYSFS